MFLKHFIFFISHFMYIYYKFISVYGIYFAILFYDSLFTANKIVSFFNIYVFSVLFKGLSIYCIMRC